MNHERDLFSGGLYVGRLITSQEERIKSFGAEEETAPRLGDRDASSGRDERPVLSASTLFRWHEQLCGFPFR